MSSQWMILYETIRIECTVLLNYCSWDLIDVCLICWKTPFAFFARLTII